MIGYILKLIFKYVISPKVWVGLFYGKSATTSATTQDQAIANETVGDRLSGENLKMLLNVIGSTNISQSQQQLQLPVSGVQELLEPLEAPPPETSQKQQTEKKHNLEPPSKENSNISSTSEDIAHEAGFTVVDDNADVDYINTL